MLGINTFVASRNGISNLKVNTGFDMANGQRYGVRKDWPELVPLLREGARCNPRTPAAGDLRTLDTVLDERVAVPVVSLDAAARRFAALPELRVGVLQHRPPFDFVDADGRHAGLANDVLALLVKHTGLKTRLVTGASMDLLLEQFAAGKLDLVLAVSEAAPGAPLRVLSAPFFSSALGVFVRKDGVFLGGLDDLFDRKVVVPAGGYAEELLRAHPRITLQPYANLINAVQALLDGRADYLVAETTSALRVIEDENFAGLRYAGPVIKAPVTLSMAVNPGVKGLKPLIDAGLATITQDEAAAIRRRWVGAPLEAGINPRKAVRWGMVLLLLTAFGFLTIYQWNRKLRREVARRTRLYAALSQCNQAIVRCTSEEELFPQICRVAVEFGGLKMAWIGIPDPDTRMVRPVASFGHHADEYLQGIEISVDADSPAGCGPSAAFREDQPVWCQNYQNDPRTAPWHERGARCGWGAMAALPLRRDGAPVGVLNLYADKAGAFDEAARELLAEMATDISFALDNFARESKRRQAEDAVVRESHRNQIFLRNASDGVHIHDLEGNVIEVSEAFCRILGYSRKELLGANVSLWDVRWSAEELKRTFAERPGKEEHSVFETRHRRRDGSLIDVEISSRYIELDGVSVIFASARDITERLRTEQALSDSEVRFRGLVEQSIAGIFIIQDGKFVYANPRFAEIRGFDSADEVIGLDPMPLIAEKDRAIIGENNRRLLAGEIIGISQSFTALRKDGSNVEVGVHNSRATYHGRPAIIGLLQDISEKKRAEEQIQQYVAQLETAFMSTVQVATTMGEMRDPYTAGHQRRVAEIAVAIGAELGFDARRQEGLRVAGYLHDIGKITVPAEILSKPDKLSTIEYELIKGHAQSGYDVLKDVEFPWPVAEIALQHHERIDGSGYPQGLKGDAILLEARIMAVADVVEAMSTHRPYRAGLGIDKALAEIEHGRGSVYDAAVADACLRLFREKQYQLPA